jgi:hypothetical protein
MAIIMPRMKEELFILFDDDDDDDSGGGGVVIFFKLDELLFLFASYVRDDFMGQFTFTVKLALKIHRKQRFQVKLKIDDGTT